ncbi:RING-H2 finger protein ATL60-like [Canna indica]|uniref:RING-type E3 ubiquitin transferase n=1 Tax=Canna indica TaxID=4628 RepID=A0AAQ3JNC0_9LILI|nr:RING-H2 finger protein ATL60-like [Canna indica]
MSGEGSDPLVDASAGGNYASAVRISTEVMIAAVIFLFMVVVFVFFLYLYAKHYLRPNSGRSRSRARFLFTAADLGPAPRRGLDPAVLSSMPITIYRASNFKEGLECSVCLSELVDGEKARLLPKCNHGFHLECIDMWFHSHSTCPLCRSPVGGEPSAKPNSHEEEQAPQPETTSAESPVFPTNVLIWGSQDQVNAGNSQEGPSSSAGALAIEIPRRGMEGLPSPFSPLPSSRMAMEEAKSPVSGRFRSLMRLWSMGKRTAGSSSSPSEGDIEQGMGASADGSALPPKSPASP